MNVWHALIRWNGPGTGALVTAWAVGACYLLAGQIGVFEVKDPGLAFKYFLIAGPLGFALVPLGIWACKSAWRMVVLSLAAALALAALRFF